jgi:hypothetical protein
MNRKTRMTTCYRPLPPPSPEETVPPRYQGVWVRTLLETPEGRDTTTHVHWLQTALWHAELRVPAGVDPTTPAGRARLEGFCGTTAIVPGSRPGEPDLCTWHRHWDVQPPRSTPDAGYMLFETPDRLIETGVNGRYLEIWERLPDSTGSDRVYLGVDGLGQPNGERLLVSGRYALRVRPRTTPWPADLKPDETLAEVVRRHPAAADALLDFELEFGLASNLLDTRYREATCPQG